MDLSERKGYSEFLYRWIRYLSKFNLSEILRKNGIGKIAIYGGGNLGIILYEHLQGSDVKVEFIIDKNKELIFPYDVQTLTPIDDAMPSELYKLDAIIITIDYYVVQEKFKEYIKCINLDDIIIDVDEFVLFKNVVKHIGNSKANFFVADLSEPVYFIKNPSQRENINKIMGFSWRNFSDREELLLEYYNDLESCTIEYCKDVFVAGAPIVHIKKDNISYLNNVNLKYFNVINNCRLTTDVPNEYHNTIHFFGNCNAVGFFTEDKYTIASYLQRMINENNISKKFFQVVNRSNWRGYAGSLEQILNTTFENGDCIVLIGEQVERFKYYMDEKWLYYIDLRSALNRPHEWGEKEILFDSRHMNHRGYKLIANKLYEILHEYFRRGLLENDDLKEKEEREEKKKEKIASNKVLDRTSTKDKNFLFSSNTATPSITSTEYQNNIELDNYLESLAKEKVETVGVIGAIVVNCNPFTLGHRYLVEQALKNCDFLYVFVVEEDKSFFPFSERLELVRKGTADLKNVKVLPSGRFIISSLTFPEYFIKEEFKTSIDASIDVELFAKDIAPILNIKKRFVGEEPFCQVTKQYNRAMNEILPRYGIELVVFERKEINSTPISATKVRALLKERDFDGLRELVPETTLEYLRIFNIEKK